MHPDDYATNLAAGLQEAFVPDYVHEFALAEKLRIPVPELVNQPIGLVRAASVLLEAEGIAQRERQRRTT